MQPSSQLTRNHRNRRLSPLPFSTLTTLRPSKPIIAHINPFNDSNNTPQSDNNDTNSREITVTNTLSNFMLSRRPRMVQELPVIKAQVKCHYCNESFSSEQIMAHVNECEMQRIPCERCGDHVQIELYDIHFEECESLGRRMEMIELRAARRGRRGVTIEGEHGRLDNNAIANVLFSGGEMSYEQLLLLDDTIEKKGMSEEEMKGMKVQLYVKSLDGEGSCNICISDYETAEYTRELPCRHKFHRDCVDKWLEANITCPTCKKYLR